MDYIEQVRKERDINVFELCKRIGVSRDTYYKWLSGKRKPKLQSIIKICEVLNIEFANIVDNFI